MEFKTYSNGQKNGSFNMKAQHPCLWFTKLEVIWLQRFRVYAPVTKVCWNFTCIHRWKPAADERSSLSPFFSVLCKSCPKVGCCTPCLFLWIERDRETDRRVGSVRTVRVTKDLNQEVPSRSAHPALGDILIQRSSEKALPTL